MKKIAVKNKFVNPISIRGKNIITFQIENSHPVFCVLKGHSQYFATNSNPSFPSFNFRQETAGTHWPQK